MATENYIFIEVPCRAENIALLRVVLASFASRLDFTISEIEEIKVAVSEAVSNVILHAYDKNEETKLIHIEAKITESGILEIKVKDSGKGIEQIDLALQPAYTTTEDRMGLGLTFIDSFMDNIKISSLPGSGTKLLMEKKPASTWIHNNKDSDPGKVR